MLSLTALDTFPNVFLREIHLLFTQLFTDCLPELKSEWNHIYVNTTSSISMGNMNVENFINTSLSTISAEEQLRREVRELLDQMLAGS